MKTHADGTVSTSAYCNKIHTLISKGLAIYRLKSAYSEISGRSVRNSVAGAATNFHSDDGGSKILCNVRTLLHGVTSKKTAKFTLSTITETTGMNAIHHTTWQREYDVQHNSTISAIPQYLQLFASGILRFRLLCDH